MIAGGAMLFTSFLGKTFIYFYRAMKNPDNMMRTAQMGKFYKGGFQMPMSKTEAKLILGVRESTQRQQIIEKHRKLMFLNHPDNGGSTYLAAKINEAKELLVHK